jgi:hypothetical protein
MVLDDAGRIFAPKLPLYLTPKLTFLFLPLCHGSTGAVLSALLSYDTMILSDEYLALHLHSVPLSV